MNERRKSRVNGIVIAVISAIIVTMASVYVVGYFVCCEQVLVIRVWEGQGKEHKQFQRLYQAEWVSTIYKPVAYVESVVTWRDVTTGFSVIAF